MGLSQELLHFLHDGTVIPAHPLALTEDRKFDESQHKLLTNYYISSGAGGVAIGVHTTQFEIRDPKHNLYERVLKVTMDAINEAHVSRPFLKIAGVCGPTQQAEREATIAKNLGYDLALVSVGGLGDYSEKELLEHVRSVAAIMPVFGFYLQPSVGGRVLSFEFWREFADIEGVLAIKMAPFNRYQTLDVVRAVCESKRRDEIALYTGNDDQIVLDLLSSYRFDVNGQHVEKRIVGGLLGHWAVWTAKAVALLEEIKAVRNDSLLSTEWFQRAHEVTDSNAAFFDAKNQFAGCIAGIHEVLRMQGLLKNRLCLNPHEELSEGQLEEIQRVYSAYPHLHDDHFVQTFLETQHVK